MPGGAATGSLRAVLALALALTVAMATASVWGPSLRIATAGRRAPRSLGRWGYVEVRPKSHMFWWLQTYKQKALSDCDPGTPLIIWLQGGPGASGTGFGQFTEVGPYDMEWSERKHAWTQQAHVLFVDNPVGTGFSYVEDGGAFAKTNNEIGEDLLAMLKGLLAEEPTLDSAPITIVCESYGGKMGVSFVKSLLKSNAGKDMKVTLNGIALGDSWISPVSYVQAWAPLLRDLSLLDSIDYEKVIEAALGVQSDISTKEWDQATDGWAKMEELIMQTTDNVDFYNILLHNVPDPDAAAAGLGMCPRLAQVWAASTEAASFSGAYTQTIHKYLGKYHNRSLSDFMNEEVRKALGSIPDDVVWGGQAGLVSGHLKADFMKNVTSDVDELLDMGANVIVYNGQLDLICCTRGTEMWMKDLKWKHMSDFYTSKRESLYVDGKCCGTQGFGKRHRNLSMYYILNAGHMIPSDNPEVASEMLSLILDYGTTTSSETGSERSGGMSDVYKGTSIL